MRALILTLGLVFVGIDLLGRVWTNTNEAPNSAYSALMERPAQSVREPKTNGRQQSKGHPFHDWAELIKRPEGAAIIPRCMGCVPSLPQPFCLFSQAPLRARKPGQTAASRVR